jgi:hypothetical protein
MYHIWQPFDITIPNIYERPKNIPKDVLMIGCFSDDGSKLCINTDGSVFRCSKNGRNTIHNEWNNFDEMLETEVSRIIGLYTREGLKINPNESILPPTI